MIKNPKKASRFWTAALSHALIVAAAFGQSPNGGLQEKLVSEYALTTPTADNTDIVTSGCVLTFKKRGLTASAITSKILTSNNFKDKDPQIRPSASTNIRKFGRIPGVPGVPGVGGGDTRVFVNGEKMFVTQIQVDASKDTVTFDLISDAFNEVRYRALLRFEFARGALANADLAQVQPILDQAIAVAPPAADANAAAAAAPGGPAAASPPAAPAAPPETALAPIAPPPPPPEETKSIENGMTREQVIGIMGQPIKSVKAGDKEILTYKDLKITFTKGKMTDAQ